MSIRTFFFLILIWTFSIGCSQSDNRQEQIDSLVVELMNSETFKERCNIPLKNALIRSNYFKQGMIVNKTERENRTNVNWLAPIEVSEFYDRVYGEKFGKKMFKMDEDFKLASLKFAIEFKEKINYYGNEVFLEAYKIASMKVTNSSNLLQSNNFILNSN